ncbi:MAG: molybdenum cofactor biosynthesis protein MoaE [Saprospiraceae bacterium]|nr:molybdenum cofactor biosynthesis protein MoaE [Bacteroidia bacterium]MBT8229790.1 molybdenum cofactor biosynthesis protein MoaE [Bacteroidia bacterium]NNF20404.1 molybdenum cofactor biosynthesis protein MoaE [Saprospiraceae bacterium]NNK89214.1 molybdenum cofactor biosynthesis protein MoaE [Saprospiraceae bacterium]
MKTSEIYIGDNDLSIDKAYAFINDNSSGGNCIFIGTARDINKGKMVEKLFFESYEAMAKNEIDKIIKHCFDLYDIKKIGIYHRTGTVNLGDKAVIIAVSSKHRDAAFQACRFAIDKLKENVPIWKKEYLDDGSYWVGSRP